VASQGQEMKRIVQSARYSSCALDYSTKQNQADKMDSQKLHHRTMSASTEAMDTADIGVHHLLELPSLLEPKGFLYLYRSDTVWHKIKYFKNLTNLTKIFHSSS